MATSKRPPRPVRSRSYSAVSTPEYAYIPAAMSATEIPALAGSAGVPVTDSSPASHWTSRS